MTEAQWEALEAYIVGLAHLMRLGLWDIRLSREPCETGSNATHEVWEDNYRGTIRIAPNFLMYSREQRRRTLTHELMHAHTRDLRRAIDLLRPILGGGAIFDMVEQAHAHAEEAMAHMLADLIAPFLPLDELSEV